MNRILRLTAVLLAAICLLNGCAATDMVLSVRCDLQQPAPLADLPYLDSSIQSPFEPVACTYYYDQLPTEACRTVYRAALEHFAAGRTDSFYLKGSYTALEVSAAMQALQYDQPQLLCAPFGQTCSYYTTSSGEVLGIELSYSEPPKGQAKMRRQLCERITQILENASIFADPFEREAYLYQTLLEQTVYDNTAAKNSLKASQEPDYSLSLEDRMTHTLYGALVNGRAVCDGYASAFQLLCCYAGIPAATIVGQAFDFMAANGTAFANGQDRNHAWNLVQLESGSYYCDPTWDDNDFSWLTADGQLVRFAEDPSGMRQIPLTALHRYLNLTFDEMSQNHTPDPDFQYPMQATGQDNYYRRRKLTVSSPAELTNLAKRLCQEQNYPELFCFEVLLVDWGSVNLSRVLPAALGGVGGYHYLLYSNPPGAEDRLFVCLYNDEP